MKTIKAAIARELHSQARRNFTRRKVELKGINDLFQADLVEMIPYARFNNGFKYIMTIINCFSKFAYAIPLKNKTGGEIANALKSVLAKNKMNHFQTDLGKEFYNKEVNSLMKKHGINHYSTYSDKKASIVERFNRTLKNLMWRKFTEQGSYSWINLLPGLVKKYNDTIHRTIGMKPKEVNSKNEENVLRRINTVLRRPRSVIKFKTGDRVRISKYKKTFVIGYIPNWTNEVFTISKVHNTRPVTYTLKDEKGEVLSGQFYAEELKRTNIKDVYLVEKILRRKGDQVLVKWLGFDKSESTWINKKDLI